jgi:Pin2-interacting protein X1
MLDFHRVLSNLTEVTSQHAAEGGPQGGEEEEEGNRDGGRKEAQGSKRPPKDESRKSGKKRKGSKGEKKEGKEVRNAAGAAQQEAAQQEAAEPEPEGAASKRRKVATHVGRFKKRESAKMVKHYSDTDLAAILGNDPFAQVAQAFAAATACQAQVLEQAAGGSGDDGHSPVKPLRAPKREKVTVVGASPQDEQQLEGQAGAWAGQGRGGEESWWSKLFHIAGGMGAAGLGMLSAVRRTAVNITGFSEQDQTNLYHKVQVCA